MHQFPSLRELDQILRTLDHLYQNATMAEYENERQRIEAWINVLLPGFTVAYALEIGAVGAGAATYQHGGVGHVLLPVQEHENST